MQCDGFYLSIVVLHFTSCTISCKFGMSTTVANTVIIVFDLIHLLTRHIKRTVKI